MRPLTGAKKIIRKIPQFVLGYFWYDENMQDYSSLSEMANTSRYVTFATVNEDGSPHNSPMFYIPSHNFDKIYMGTHPDSLHARNISRTGQAFAVIFGQTPEGGAGIYFKIVNFHEVDESELPRALEMHNGARARLGKAPLLIDYYRSPNPQRMYVGDIIEISTNGVVRGGDGKISRDTRDVISPEDIIL